ncbi:hypothetical protein MMC30_009249, partial [Trapelia coarctata]|nr:hypothetical protein [Trapelia coarctata]
MKASVSLAAVFLALGPAIVSAQAVNGVLPFLPTAVPRALADHDGLVERTDSQGCNADNVLRALRNAKQSQEASAFCSTFIQPTTTTTSTNTIPKTDVIVVQTTETILTTATVTTAIATNTVLCPPPASTTTKCNIRAYGFSQFLISQEPGVSSAACEQKCLADPNCKSYQTQLDGASFCNLFRVKTEGNVQIIDQDNFYFFDRECPDNRP